MTKKEILAVLLAGTFFYSHAHAQTPTLDALKNTPGGRAVRELRGFVGNTPDHCHVLGRSPEQELAETMSKKLYRPNAYSAAEIQQMQDALASAKAKVTECDTANERFEAYKAKTLAAAQEINTTKMAWDTESIGIQAKYKEGFRIVYSTEDDTKVGSIIKLVNGPSTGSIYYKYNALRSGDLNEGNISYLNSLPEIMKKNIEYNREIVRQRMAIEQEIERKRKAADAAMVIAKTKSAEDEAVRRKEQEAKQNEDDLKLLLQMNEDIKTMELKDFCKKYSIDCSNRI
jgi:hypothetical protein